MLSDDVRIEVNGCEADEAAVSLLDHEGWGHFTAMQVRGGRTRGLGLQLARLEAAHREVYGRALSGEEVRARVRHALGGQPDASVRVYGYTDAVGTNAYNFRLSERRAETVAAELVDIGLAPGRVYVIGKGKRDPVGDNRTDAGRAQNRRAAIVVSPR